MFSPDDFWQEVAALVITAGALLYLVIKLTGWRPWGVGRSTPPGPPVTTSRRLARGLAKAHRQK